MTSGAPFLYTERMFRPLPTVCTLSVVVFAITLTGCHTGPYRYAYSPARSRFVAPLERKEAPTELGTPTTVQTQAPLTIPTTPAPMTPPDATAPADGAAALPGMEGAAAPLPGADATPMTPSL